MTTVDLTKCLADKEKEYKTLEKSLTILKGEIDSIRVVMKLVEDENAILNPGNQIVKRSWTDEVDEVDEVMDFTVPPAAAGSPAATEKNLSFTQVVRKDIGDKGFVPPKAKPQLPSTLHHKIARTFDWCEYLDKTDNKIKADMSNISGNLNMQFQKKKRNGKGKLALVTTSDVKPDQTGIYVVTLTGDNSGKLDPDVNGTLGWKKNIPLDIDEKYCKTVVDSVDHILSVRCKEYLLLEVTETAIKHCPYRFSFMRFYYNN